MIPNDPASPWFLVHVAVVLTLWYYIGAYFITRFSRQNSPRNETFPDLQEKRSSLVRAQPSRRPARAQAHAHH
jgi:hypothetical protein